MRTVSQACTEKGSTVHSVGSTSEDPAEACLANLGDPESEHVEDASSEDQGGAGERHSMPVHRGRARSQGPQDREASGDVESCEATQGAALLANRLAEGRPQHPQGDVPPLCDDGVRERQRRSSSSVETIATHLGAGPVVGGEDRRVPGRSGRSSIHRGAELSSMFAADDYSHEPADKRGLLGLHAFSCMQRNSPNRVRQEAGGEGAGHAEVNGGQGSGHEGSNTLPAKAAGQEGNYSSRWKSWLNGRFLGGGWQDADRRSLIGRGAQGEHQPDVGGSRDDQGDSHQQEASRDKAGADEGQGDVEGKGDLGHGQDGGDSGIGENPLTSASFVTEPMKRVLNHPEVYAAVDHGCRFGVKHPQTGEPMRKATLWFSTSREICDELGKRCKNEETRGHHSHAHCLGGASVTRHAGVYTREIAEAKCKGYVRMLKRKDPGRIRVMLRGRMRRMRNGEKTTEPVE